MRTTVLAILVLLVLSTTLLAGCGQKGPLYMPDDETEQSHH
ncbi:LPS translocon maturation chaperone LptM [Alkalilimnicola ehrlichii MLHE-1]|uniref:Lipopeptide n=1 Tax=Alkalilimnicola ehrlichii (strain ATCC BAA-1101 / DSM 17681 / MLHE-1) TaxID=187272 RepID=Q0AC72_ALKEH|nr:lipoprotein [Alkalilimnicola ehrlichii]ABI55565.1 hypothetical protein Mlg_0210 [Alkalilimnicola ehrlichii MLHE-1]